MLEPDLLVHGESPVAFLALLLEISALDVNGLGEANVMATLFRAVGKVGNAELGRLDVLQFESLKQEETILTFTTTVKNPLKRSCVSAIWVVACTYYLGIVN